MAKLKSIKKELRVWNVRQFGQVDDRIKATHTELQGIKSLMYEQGFLEDVYNAEIATLYVWNYSNKNCCSEINFV